MTQEEAIKILRETHDNALFSVRTALETICPELAESEDERIRIALVNEISGWSDVYKMFQYAPKDKVLAYLEKLKEPIDPFDTKLFQDGVKEGRRLEREDMEREQKSVECSRDKRIRKALMVFLKDFNSGIEINGVSAKDMIACLEKQECGEKGLKGPQEIGDWVGDEGVCKKQKEQKPAEVTYVEDSAKCGAGVAVTGDPYSKDSMKPVKSEWSEEDFALIVGELVQDVIANEKDAANYGDSKKPTSFFVKKYIERLKSLRPQPKQDSKCEDCPNRGNTHQYLKGSKDRNRDLALSFMNYLDENKPEGKMCLSNGECADIEQAFQDMDWGRIIRYAEKYQPKQDWNEEDEKHLDSIIESYKELLKDYSANNGVDYIPYNTSVVARTVLNDIKFLKSRRPQLSDEDIKKIRSEEYTKGFNDAAFGGKAWKPSEKQMEVLNKVVSGEVLLTTQHKSLESLYNDLKKLM